MVLVDSSILLFLFDPATRSDVPQARERVDFLVYTLSKASERIIIPTPVLTECLIHTGRAGVGYLSVLNKQAVFRVVPFDQRAAIEAAEMMFNARQAGLPKGGPAHAARAKIKFDRQIVAIAAVEGATTIYTNDNDIVNYAAEVRISVQLLPDLPLPPEDAQASLPLNI